jgi:hypothetical protein
MGDEIEEAERLRDPSHVRNYSDTEWRGFVLEAGLGLGEVACFAHSFDAGAWLARTGCEGDEAARVLGLLGSRVADGRLTLDKIAINAVKGA